jgi:diaminopimelate epimerase
MAFPFVKMNGLGNDFVVVPDPERRFAPTCEQVRALSSRSRPTGCDQLISIIRSDGAEAGMRIWNADGGEVEHCGNAARCVAWLVMRALGVGAVRIAAPAGLLPARRAGEERVTIDMGEPRLGWRDIPLACEMETREIGLPIDPALGHPGCVSMGNSHVVFFVPDLDLVPVTRSGPGIERHWLFPERVNVGFAEIRSRSRIRLRVWERGAGLTRACGTGACAAVVAAHRRDLVGRSATVEMDGGDLQIEWGEADDHVQMTGPVTVEFTGVLDLSEIAA